jgi:hypothetical protein
MPVSSLSDGTAQWARRPHPPVARPQPPRALPRCGCCLFFSLFACCFSRRSALVVAQICCSTTASYYSAIDGQAALAALHVQHDKYKREARRGHHGRDQAFVDLISGVCVLLFIHRSLPPVCPLTGPRRGGCTPDGLAPGRAFCVAPARRGGKRGV